MSSPTAPSGLAQEKDGGLAAVLQLDPRRNRFLLLLASLVLLLLLSPLLEGDRAGNQMLTLLFSLVLLAAVLASSGRRWTLAVALLLALPWLYLSWLHPLWRADSSDVASNLLIIGLGLFVLGLLLKSVLAAGRVGADTLCGAVAAYLLIAVVWALSYGVIEALLPGSFGFAERDVGTLWNRMLYFSLVTLSTLGYGDITPGTPVAQVWSALEAICGTLYLAVLIARLVGVYKG